MPLAVSSLPIPYCRRPRATDPKCGAYLTQQPSTAHLVPFCLFCSCFFSITNLPPPRRPRTSTPNHSDSPFTIINTVRSHPPFFCWFTFGLFIASTPIIYFSAVVRYLCSHFFFVCLEKVDGPSGRPADRMVHLFRAQTRSHTHKQITKQP